MVVSSRQAIASDMFAHVALAGIGGAVWLSVSPWWGALPALLLVSTLLWWLTNQENYSPDSLSMFFLSGGLALALMFVHLAKNQTFSFENYLFGSILTISQSEIVTILGLTILVILTVYKLWYQLLGVVQSPAYLIPFKIKPKLIQLIYFWILAAVVWVGIKTIGGLLIGALLVIPTLVVKPFFNSFKNITCGAVLVSVLSVVFGLLLAVVIDLPPSSLIIFCLIGLFVGQLILRKIFNY
jgi:zinc transport system permease protein